MFQRMARSLHARNPFYLLSALSMLAGCFALSRALGTAPGQWKPLVALMGVLQLYELVLLGLAVLLYRRVNMPSDARMAFLLGLLFVSDSTYLNTELATSNPWAAPWVALAHLAFLVPKLIFLRDTLGLTSLRTLALTVAQVAFLVYIPGTFSAVHFMDSKVHALGLGRAMLPLVVYGLWWLVGALPVLYLWADRPPEHGDDDFARPIGRASLLVPGVSILLHLLTLHWLYDLPIYGAYLTPLYLGIAVNVAYTLVRVSEGWRTAFQWGGPLVAVLFSRVYSDELVFTLGESFIVTPLRIALVGAAVIFWIHRSISERPSFVWASILTTSLAVSGPTFSAMRLRWTNLFPETYAEFGIAAVAVAFAMLLLALAVSLWRPRRPPEDRHPPMTNGRVARYAE